MQNHIHLFLRYHHAEQTETPRFNVQPLSSSRCNCLLCRVTRSCHWLLYYSWKQYLALMNLPLAVEGKICICTCKGGSGEGSQGPSSTLLPTDSPKRPQAAAGGVGASSGRAGTTGPPRHRTCPCSSPPCQQLVAMTHLFLILFIRKEYELSSKAYTAKIFWDYRCWRKCQRPNLTFLERIC